jgi:hypothetical protein
LDGDHLEKRVPSGNSKRNLGVAATSPTAVTVTVSVVTSASAVTITPSI